MDTALYTRRTFNLCQQRFEKTEFRYTSIRHIWRGLQIMKVLILCFFSFPFHSSNLGSNILLSILFSNNLSIDYPLKGEIGFIGTQSKQSHTLIRNQSANFRRKLWWNAWRLTPNCSIIPNLIVMDFFQWILRIYISNTKSVLRVKYGTHCGIMLALSGYRVLCPLTSDNKSFRHLQTGKLLLQLLLLWPQI